MKKHSPQQNSSSKRAFSFTITPATTSETPYLLQPGKTVVFTIQVQNQSAIPDLIFLKCSELPEHWFTIQYLNHDSEDALGIVQLSEKLSLNPQASGEIQLVLHPPADAALGNYFPTLQLISMSAPDLVTLDVIYVQLLPDTHLDTKLTPENRVIADRPVALDFRVRNRGNVERTFRLEAKDSGNLFRFETDPANQIIHLAPGQEMTIALKASPRNPWQRPLKGNPVRANLSITLISTDDLAGLALRHSTQGRLLWLPHPPWVLALLILMGTGAALIALGILYRFNRPPIASAEVLNFNLTGRGNAVKLNWRLNNPETLGKVVVSQLNEGAEIQTNRYDFSNSIPSDLNMQAGTNQGCRYAAPAKNISSALWQLPLPNLPGFSSLQQTAAPTTLECQNIPFNSKPAGSMRYKLKLFSKSNAQTPIAEYTTNEIAGQSANPGQSSPQIESNFSNPSPRILEFTVNGIPAQSQPAHTYSVGAGEVAEIVVSWSVQGSTDIQLLPTSGRVGSSGSVTYTLQAGENKTITLTAQNSAGERATQSVVINAIALSNIDRAPFRSGSPIQPAPKPRAKPVEPARPVPENNQDNPQPTPTVEPSNAPIDQTSPTSSTSGTPTPEPAPTASP